MGRLTCMILFSSFLGIWTPATGMSLKRTTASFFVALRLPRFSVASIKAERSSAKVRDEQRGPTVPGSESTCWHLISFVLPTFLRLVGEEEDAVAEDLGLRELQRRLSGPVLEQALAGAHHDRVDQEPELVEEALTQQRTDKRGAPEDGDVLPVLPLEL